MAKAKKMYKLSRGVGSAKNGLGSPRTFGSKSTMWKANGYIGLPHLTTSTQGQCSAQYPTGGNWPGTHSSSHHV